MLELSFSIPFGLPGKKRVPPAGAPLTRLRRAGQFEAPDDGMLVAIPGELWKMLWCLATYMEEALNIPKRPERTAMSRQATSP